MTTLAIVVIRVDAPNLAMFRRIDWVHLAAMAIFLGGLEYVLEEGPRHDWFDDARIQIGAWLSCVGFALFLERSFFSASPIVKLTPFRKPTFVFACVFNLVIGFGIYASTYLVPVFLGRVRGYYEPRDRPDGVRRRHRTDREHGDRGAPVGGGRPSRRDHRSAWRCSRPACG